MTTTSFACRAMTIGALAALCACGSSETGGGGGGDAAADSVADASVDSTADVAPEATPDATGDAAPEASPDGGSGGYVGRVVGLDGITGYDGLATTDKNALKATKVAFFHASVGGNILSGADTLGFSFQAISSGASYGTVTLGQYDYGSLNGNPTGKIDELSKVVGVQGVGAAAKLIGAKLCWVDFDSGTDLSALESKYQGTLGMLRVGSPTARFFHVTPPLKTSADASVNPKRLQFGQWLSTTYGADAVVLDLATIESTDAAGATCTAGGARALCAAWASDDGHLNAAGQARAAKAFLYALHVARTAAGK